MARWSRVLLGASLLVLISGCVRESVDGDRQQFTYELWLSGLVLVGGIVAIPAGLALRKRIPRLGWSLLIGGPLAAFGFAPSLFFEKVTLNDKTLHVQSGIWGMTAIHSVSLDDLKSVRLIVEHSTGRKGRKVQKYYLMCDLKSGGSSKIPVNNNVTEAAAPHFIQRVRERGIPVYDQT